MVERHIKIFNHIAQSRSDFHVLFMDDGSSDKTIDCFRYDNLEILFPYQYEWEEDRGFCSTRAKNRGIRLARSEWIMILDGDNFIDPDTLTEYDKVIQDKDLVYFGKRIDVIPSDIDDAIYSGFVFPQDLEDFRGEIRDIPPAPFYHFSGANFVVSKDRFQKIEFCVDDWIGYGFDDYYFSLSWCLLGLKIVAVPAARSYHCQGPGKPVDSTNKRRLNQLIRDNAEQVKELFGEVKQFQ